MSIDGRVLSLIHTLYDAALDEALWPNALKELSHLTRSQAATFWSLETSGKPRLPIFTAYNFDDRFIRDYLNDMVPSDPTIQYLVTHPNTPIVHDGLVLTEREKDFSAYYDWQRRQSDINYRMVGQARPTAELQAGVALHRTRKTGRYEPDDLELFAFIYKHLQRALALSVRLGSLGAMNAFATAMLDRDSAAILLLDQNKHILYANARAEGYRNGQDGVRLSRRGLVLLGKQENAKLDQHIERVLKGGTGAILYATRPSGKRPLCVAVAAMRTEYTSLSAFRPAVCITITDPETTPRLEACQVSAAFGLSEAEAKLTVLLATGKELRAAANSLGITYGTARARLAQIFGKTGTRRQAELVRLVLTGLAGI